MPKKMMLQPGARTARKLRMALGKQIGSPVSGLLSDMLATAVPLWILRIKEQSGKPTQADWQWLRVAEDILETDSEYLICKPPPNKAGASARAFNTVARAIAILAFMPYGITLFGRKWEAH